MVFLRRVALAQVLLSSALGWGCQAQQAPTSPESVRPRTEEIQVNEVPPLTLDEEALIEPLRARITHLSGKIGERNEQNQWELADAADYLVGELESMGMPVERQGYETQNVAAQNLAVTIPGGERGDQVFVVGVHYDSPAGDRGINAGGSATAALLSLVELMKDARLKRSLRFVFFSMGESPHGDGDARGARLYARLLTEKPKAPVDSPLAPAGGGASKKEAVGVLLLDRLGSFEPTQNRAAPLQFNLEISPDGGIVRNFIDEDVDKDIWALSERAQVADETDSDLLAFVGSGIQGASLSGTGDEKSPVQYEELARAVMQIRRTIGRICGEKPANDGILTPMTQKVR